MARLSLQILKISLQILNCRENRARDRFASDCILSQRVRSLRINKRMSLKTARYRGISQI